MPFNSYPYLAFIVIVVIGYRLIEARWPVARRIFLLLVSYAFYAWWRADFLLLLIGSTVVNFAFGAVITNRVKQGRPMPSLVTLGLVFNLGLIALFKYSGLLVSTADDLFGLSYPIPHLFLPLAISFFTFEQISYLIDAGRGRAPRYSFIDYALFVGYFPHLIAGPIVRHNDLIPQFHESRSREQRTDDAALGVTLFTIGLAKKVLIADNLAPYADTIFAAAHRGLPISSTDSWLGTLFFGFQIYFDFSAYTDMALGSSCLLGIRLPFNFNSPYKAASAIDFWRRWHISLSIFLRDYLYFSLGGNRRGKARRYINLMLTMLLGGLWHGANWTFMLWGGLHGLYLAVNHAFRDLRTRFKVKPVPERWRWLAHGVSVLGTFACVTLAWVVFRAPDLRTAGAVLSGLIGQGGGAHLVTFSPLAAVALVALFAIVWLSPNSMEITWAYRPALPPASDTDLRDPGWLAWRPTRQQAIAYGVLCIVAVLALSNLSPFIYFQF
ncbi:MAG: MBOAT family protein [Alphaproteobacteria bacterium]|nr:MBOAT family protein [Alphaproteobacteria bacterium]MBV9419293.1 MBOAT family protein [Alphaproteobacteria bacterium]